MPTLWIRRCARCHAIDSQEAWVDGAMAAAAVAGARPQGWSGRTGIDGGPVGSTDARARLPSQFTIIVMARRRAKRSPTAAAWAAISTPTPRRREMPRRG
jgi:hypothetical protein